MARRRQSPVRPERRGGTDASSLELIRDKERELTDLVRAAKSEAEGVIARAMAKAAALEANAAAEAAAEAETYLRSELVRIEREAEEIVSRSGTEVEAVRRTAARRMAQARDFVRACVVPECS